MATPAARRASLAQSAGDSPPDLRQNIAAPAEATAAACTSAAAWNSQLVAMQHRMLRAHRMRTDARVDMVRRSTAAHSPMMRPLECRRGLPLPLPEEDDGAITSSRFSLRHSLQPFFRSLLPAPLAHSIFHARTSLDARRSTGRLILVLGVAVANALTLAKVGRSLGAAWRRVKRNVVGPSSDGADLAAVDARFGGDPEPGSSAVEAITHSLTSVRTLPFPTRVASYALLLTGGVIALTSLIGLARAFDVIPVQREGYEGIAASMAMAKIRFARRRRKEDREMTLAEQSTDGADEGATSSLLSDASHAFRVGLRVITAPLVEESVSYPVLNMVMYCLGKMRLPSNVLSRATISGVVTGALHWGIDGERVATTGVRAALGEFLFLAHPILPLAYHVTLNWLAHDCYAAISPLRGLRVVADGGGGDDQKDPHLRALYLNLRHHFDPAHHQLLLSSTVLIRSTPGLRSLVPGAKHPMWTQASSKASTFSRKANRPPPREDKAAHDDHHHVDLWRMMGGGVKQPVAQISKHYEQVISALFTTLVNDNGSSSSSPAGGSPPFHLPRFTFLFLLLPQPLDILRGAFSALDTALSDQARQEELEKAQRSYRAHVQSPAWAAMSAQEQSEAEYAHAMKERRIHQHTDTLEVTVIHGERKMPSSSASPRHRERALPFVCTEWIGQPTSTASRNARDFLIYQLTAVGGACIPPEDDGRHSKRQQHYTSRHLRKRKIRSGWKIDEFWARRLTPEEEEAEEEDGGEDEELDHPGDLSPSNRARFLRLMALFRAYTHLLCAAAFDAHVRHYGELVEIERSAEDEAKEAGADGPPVRPRRSERRLTQASFHRWMRDLALVDARGTDALLTQATITINGTMPHPMHVFNVAFNTFK